MKKTLFVSLVALVLFSFTAIPSFAKPHGTHGTDGKVTGRSLGAGALSLLIWPGIGQSINDQNKEKVITHAVLGLTGIFRIWSCYDAIVDRNGGVWHSRI